ncbi:zinc finger protein 696-like, partial [Megalops cyprinoides]|uniref:zinc finger protein 696-like n=1 Tax=Megalops cyprinoides TaxID=118141 RepID=UPI001863E920
REEGLSCSCGQPYQQHARAGPGCPLSPSFHTFLSLKPREGTTSSRAKPPQSDRNCLSKDSSAGPVDLGLGLGLVMSLEEAASDPTCPFIPQPGQRLSKQRGRDSEVQSPVSVQDSPPQSPAPFPCLSCHRTFQTCAQLLRHQQSHGQQEGVTQHLCMHCAASFPRPSLLLQHQRSQHASKPCGFLCTECGRAFNSHSNLRIHLNVHTGARPYACDDCGKSFSQSGALRVHRRIHTGERPYTCTYCGRGFSNLAGLRAHERTHTGEKPYPCPQCGKCFTQSGALKIHTRIHTGERPFICGHCGKGFSSHSGIRFHHRTVHGVALKASVGKGTGAQPGSSPGTSPSAVSAIGPCAGASLGPLTNSKLSPPTTVYPNANTSVSPGTNPKAGNSPSMDVASTSFSGPASPSGSSSDLRTGRKALPKAGGDSQNSGLDLTLGSAERERRMLLGEREDYRGQGQDAPPRNGHRVPERHPTQGAETGGEGGVHDKERVEGEIVDSLLQ